MNTFITKYIRPAVVITLLLTVITGPIYPGIVTALAQVIFPYQANGSLHYVNGQLVGSDLIRNISPIAKGGIERTHANNLSARSVY